MLGVSVDYNAANQAFAEKLGLKYPLLSDTRREMTRDYGVLYDDKSYLDNPRRIGAYLRAKRAWFIIDKTGVIRYARVEDPRGLVPNDEILEVLARLK